MQEIKISLRYLLPKRVVYTPPGRVCKRLKIKYTLPKRVYKRLKITLRYILPKKV